MDRGYKELLARLDRLSEENKQLTALSKPQRKEKYYNYKEAASILCITVEGLKTRIKRGQMRRISNGNRPLIADAEIMRYLHNLNPDEKEFLQKAG